MKLKRFRFYHVLLILVALIAIRAIYYSFSDGFNLKRIENSFPRKSFESEPPSTSVRLQMQKICEQPFTYLGKGSQAYAFESEDKQYVLKLFKCYHLKPVDWLHKLPLVGYFDRYRKEQVERRDKKLKATLQSYKIARDVIPEECAIIYLQIVPSPHFKQKISFKDKVGRSHTLDLANYGFILQRKAKLIFPTLDKLIKENKTKEAKAMIREILHLLISRSKKGVQDQDPDLHKNAGMIDDRAYCIDIGGFHMNEKIKEKNEMAADLKKVTRRLYKHLKSEPSNLAHYLADYIDEEIQRLIYGPTS